MKGGIIAAGGEFFYFSRIVTDMSISGIRTFSGYNIIQRKSRKVKWQKEKSPLQSFLQLYTR